MGTLYIVGTPIGNLEDVSLRALRVLREVSLIAAEDTRTTKKLLSHYGIGTPTISYFEHNKLARREHVLGVLEEHDVALVSEAGMPGISDPGYDLISGAIALGVPVVVVPGPNAALTALAISGLPTDQFVFLGFIPRQARDRRRLLASLIAERRTMVAFEAPHRLIASLEDIARVLGNRRIAVARELTKLYEEVLRGPVMAVLDEIRKRRPRGEFTIVIEGRREGAEAWSEEEVDTSLSQLVAEGLSGRDAIGMVAELSGWAKHPVYSRWVKLRTQQRFHEQDN